VVFELMNRQLLINKFYTDPLKEAAADQDLKNKVLDCRCSHSNNVPLV